MRVKLLSFLALLLICEAISATDSRANDSSQPAVEKISDALFPENGVNAPATSQAPREKTLAPVRVLFITSKECPTCEKELSRLRGDNGDFHRMKKSGWDIGESSTAHLQIVDREAIPEIVQQLNVREFPLVAAVSEGEIVRSFKEGCTTPLDQWTFWWLLTGKNERPRGHPSLAATVAHTGSYPLRGNHWSVDGDWNPTRERLIGHLRGAVHANQIAANYQIESWSNEELRSLHDDLHEREMGGVVYGGTAAAAAINRPSYLTPKTSR